MLRMGDCDRSTTTPIRAPVRPCRLSSGMAPFRVSCAPTWMRQTYRRKTAGVGVLIAAYNVCDGPPQVPHTMSYSTDLPAGIGPRRYAVVSAAFALVLVILLIGALWPDMPLRHAALAPSVYTAPGNLDSLPFPAAGLAGALPVQTDDPLLNRAEQVALRVLQRNAWHGVHIAAPFYDSAWIRDSFAWGMIPASDLAGGALSAYPGTELDYWLARQRPQGDWITKISGRATTMKRRS